MLIAFCPASELNTVAIAGFPNGYFSSDLNPFENYALAKLLFEKYGYELFGIGASLIGFLNDSFLEDHQVKELIADLAKLYDTPEEIFDNLSKIIKINKHLFIKYTEELNL